MEKPYLSGSIKLDELSLQKVFLYNLNQTHSILLHLAEHLPKLSAAIYYGDLQNAVEELSAEVKVQINRINDIYLLIKEVPVSNNRFNTSKLLPHLTPNYEYEPNDHLLKDLAFVFYLQGVVGIKINYFSILKSIANTLNNINIKQYLQYCFDECEDNQLILKLIAKEYMESTINVFLQ
jgi:ferritin-like metal-binding protein YciE